MIGLRATVGLFGVALVGLAVYGFIRLAIELADDGDWILFSALMLFVIGSAIVDVARGRRAS